MTTIIGNISQPDTEYYQPNATAVCEEHDKRCQFTKDKSYVLAMANSFLNYFFDELENGIDQVMQKSTIMQDTARFIHMPSELVASKASGLLKTEVKQALNEEVSKLDESMFTRVFGIVTASMIAVSTYAYMVWNKFIHI